MVRSCVLWGLAMFGIAQSAGAGAAPAAITVAGADGDVVLSTSRLEWELDGPFALRRIELQVRNPHERPLEATVTVALAANERLHGYALDVDGELRQAVAVERVKAEVAFEDTVRAQVDPALARKDAGNRYSIRVFPVPAGGERRLRIDVASLAGREACGWRHRLQPALPSAQAVAASVVAKGAPGTRPVADGTLAWKARDGHYEARWTARGAAAARDACLPAPAGDAAFASEFDDGLRMHWLEVPAGAAVPAARPLPARVEVVWDASYGMLGVDRGAELELLSRFLRGRRVELTLSVLRQSVDTRHLVVASDTQVDELLASLRDQAPDGATALGDWRADPQAEAVLMFSDMVATLPGEVAPPPVPVFVAGPRVGDPAMARLLTRSGGQVLDLATLSPQQALARLRQAPALQVRLGPLDSGWYPESHAGSSVLRACHVATGASSTPALDVLHAAGAAAPVARSHRATPARASELAAFWCASWQAEGLEAQAELHRAELAALGERFGVANRETSLLVLETDEDYVRHGILPPAADAALHERVLHWRQFADEARAEAVAANREDIDDGWQARVAWWNTRFPKDDPRPRWEKERRREAAREARERRRSPTPMPPPMSAPAPVGAADTGSAGELDSIVVTGAHAGEAAAITMQLQAVPTDAPWVADLRGAQQPAALHRQYLDLRTRFGQSPAFHFDVAQRLFELGDRARGWQVLSNLVELMPYEPAGLRLVAYRLQDAGLHAEAVLLLRRIVALSPQEPQSFRDLALALQAPATCQEALDLLAHVVETPWPDRFADVGLVALAEHNDLRTRCTGARPATLPAQLAQSLPVGLRVTLRWDLDDTDIDLHVTDPNGETVYYGHPGSYQGGRISRDFTAGYGPEEFVLRDPIPGAYKVEVNYYGSRLATLSRGAGVNVALQTGFGTPALQQQSISLRLLEQSGKVAVGGFTVARDGRLEVAR